MDAREDTQEARSQVLPQQDVLPARQVVWRHVSLTARNPVAYMVSGPCWIGGVSVYNGAVQGITSFYDAYSIADIREEALIGRTDTAGSLAVGVGPVRCSRGLVCVRPSSQVVVVIHYAVEVLIG